MNNKVIITNLAALKSKYGAAGLKKVRAAIKTLITADKARGFQTRLVALDSATTMKKLKDKKVVAPLDPKQNKDAVDAIYNALAPDYLLLLGSIDVIPHQDLLNPVFGTDDPDHLAPGDLPYSCAAPYSQHPQDFIGPTRVVGRLPDLTGATDPAYLLGLLATAANWKSLTPADYSAYFGISADVWKNSTALSLQKIFGSSTALQLAPPGGPNWTATLLASRSHFINCHGAEVDPQFYGQKGSSYPVSHRAAYINGKITEGTVAAIECCYGAQLYDPNQLNGQAGIGNTYLANKAYGYFGSSTIAYGPAAGNGSADLICQYFLRRVVTGASLGRAALEARQEFAGGAAELDPVDLKTLAQFSLLGDPSIHPVAVDSPQTSVAKPQGLAVAKALFAEAADAAVARADRRRQLLARGLRIGATQAFATKMAKPKLAQSILASLKQMAAKAGLASPRILSFNIDAPAAAKASLARAMKAGPMTKMAAPDALHVVTSVRTVAGIATPQIVAMIAKEAGGKITSYREMHSR